MVWYKTFYDEHYLKEYASGLTNERTQREVDFHQQYAESPASGSRCNRGRANLGSLLRARQAHS